MKMEEARERMRREHVRLARQKKDMETNMVSAFMPNVAIKVTQAAAAIPVADYPPVVRSTKKFRIKPNCWKNKHEFTKIDDRFQRCKECNVLICYNPPKPKLGLLPEYIRNRRFPPTGPGGRYYSSIYISPVFRIRRNYYGDLRFDGSPMLDTNAYTFQVKFRRGWCETQGFGIFQWDKIIEAIEPILHTNNPVAIYNEAQRAIYGRCWNAAYKNLL